MNNSENHDTYESKQPVSSLMLSITIGLIWILGIQHALTYNSPYPRFTNFPLFFRLIGFYAFYAHIPVIIFHALLCLIGTALGKYCLRRIFLRTQQSASSEKDGCLTAWPIALVLGWSIIAYAVMALTFCGLLSLTSITVVLAMAILIARNDIRQISIDAKANIKIVQSVLSDGWQQASPAIRILVCLTGWIAFNTFLSALMPPTQSDGLRYHLTVPKMNLEAGGLADFPYFSFSKFPMTVEMLFTVPLAFGLPSGAKLIHLTFFIVCLKTVSILAQGRPARWAAPLILLTIPFIPFLATWTFIELALTAYLLMAWYAFRNALDDKGNDKAWWFLSALMSGLAMGSKYTSVFNHALLCLGALAWMGSTWKEKLKNSVGYGLIGTIVAAPWWIKNVILTGNPVFPLAGGLFGAPGWSAFDNAFYFYHAGDKGSFNALPEMSWLERIFDFVSLPMRVTCFPLPDEGFGDWPPGVLSLAFLPLLVIAFIRGNFNKRIELFYAFLLFLIWSYTYRDARFLLPCFALLAPHLGQIIVNLWHSKAFRFSLTAALVSQGIWMTAMWCDKHAYMPWAVVGGKPPLIEGYDRSQFENPVDAYLAGTSKDTYSYYPALLWLDKNLPEDAVLYVHGLHTHFYFPRRTIGSDWFDTEPITEAAKEGQSAEEILDWLRQNGVTHFFFARRNRDEYEKKSLIPYYSLFSLPEAQGLEAVEELRKLTILRIRDNLKWRQEIGKTAEEIKRRAWSAGTRSELERLCRSGIGGIWSDPLYDDSLSAIYEMAPAEHKDI